jgi:hypothetical protein
LEFFNRIDPKRTLPTLGRSRCLAVRRFGGVEKTARFLNVGTESVMNYARTGSMPPNLAKKLGKATKINWRFLLSPV